MMSKDAKKNYVEEMKKNFTDNESVMIAQYQGLNVNELDELRKQLREKGILFKITKNRITKIAIKENEFVDLNQLKEIFNKLFGCAKPMYCPEGNKIYHLIKCTEIDKHF